MSGTPKTLRDAIRMGVCTGPLKDIDENVYRHVRDFLAQKFGATMLIFSERQDIVDVAQNLFTQCVEDLHKKSAD